MPARVHLVSMPWGLLTEPCLGVSILQTKLDEAHIESAVVYANLWLLHWLRPETYEAIADAWATNDFLFTGDLDPHLETKQIETLIASAPQFRSTSRFWDQFSTDEQIASFLVQIRAEAIPPYLEFCANKILGEEPLLVGFSCLFDQTFPSVALARLIKQRRPETEIVFGGYAVEGETGLHLLDTFPWIDGIHQGDGEDAIVPLARAAMGLSSWDDIPGLTRRSRRAKPRSKIVMDASPVPQFRDFFEAVVDMECQHQVRIHNLALSIETSRGCWWGQKNHCIFCGIDDETMKYRQRSPENVLSVLEELTNRHGPKVFRFADYILPHSYHRTLMPQLQARQPTFQLACEMKANATFAILKGMSDAGFLEIQPGIESFSTEVLKKMRKGVTAIQNVSYLKAARILGLKIHYNILYGFPFDELNWYQAQVALIPSLTHLEAPISHINVLTTRYAPMQQQPQAFGLPPGDDAHWRYDVMFSEDYLRRSGFTLSKYAYYFGNRYKNSSELRRLYRIINHQVENWVDRIDRGDIPSLTFDLHADELHDSRFPRAMIGKPLTELERLLLLIGNFEAIGVASAASQLDVSIEELQRTLSAMQTRRLVYCEGGKFISLPVWTEGGSPVRWPERLVDVCGVPRLSFEQPERVEQSTVTAAQHTNVPSTSRQHIEHPKA